ncbi:MAG: polysaccharide biosynthesis protein, partial [Ruminiclostridium sp.]|nr:polysaccharide biosynthesis protein [Ruminiclostridium sp.]
YTNVFNIFQSFVYVIAAGLMLVIRFAIEIFFEPEFYISYVYTPFLILSVSFTCFSTFMGSVYVASRKSVRSMTTAAIGAAVNIILNIVLIKTMGLHGGALAAFISFLIIFIIRAVDTKKIVRMDMKIPKMLINSALLLIMSCVIFFVTDIVMYYVLLALMFVIIAGINFRSGLKAVKIILKKEKFEE